MPFAFRHPKRNDFLYRSLFALMLANPFAGNDIDQLRAIMHVVVSAAALWKYGVAEGKFLDAFFVWCEKYFNLPPVRSRDLDTLLLPSLHCFQVTSFRMNSRVVLSYLELCLRWHLRETVHKSRAKYAIDYKPSAPKIMVG